MGNSRCATIAAAYLMIKKDYSATQALQYMRNSRWKIFQSQQSDDFVFAREVQPNLGFLQQLAVKDNQLRKERYKRQKKLALSLEVNCQIQ